MNRILICLVGTAIIGLFLAGAVSGDMDISDVSVDILEQEVVVNGTAAYNLSFNINYSGTGPNETDVEFYLNSPDDGWSHHANPKLMHLSEEDRYTISIGVSANESVKNMSVFQTRIVIDNSNGTSPDIIYLNTTLNRSEIRRGVEVNVSREGNNGDHGGIINVPILIENTGKEVDDIQLFLKDTKYNGPIHRRGVISWIKLVGYNSTAKNSMFLEDCQPGRAIIIDMNVSIPTSYFEAEPGIYSYNLSVWSDSNRSSIVYNDIHVEINAIYDIGMNITRSDEIRVIDPSGTKANRQINYTIEVVNNGNTKENITLMQGYDNGPFAEFNGSHRYTIVELGPHEMASVNLRVSSSYRHKYGKYNITVIALGGGDIELVQVLQVRHLNGKLKIGEIEIIHYGLLEHGDSATIEVEIYNNGSTAINDLNIELEIDDNLVLNWRKDVPANDSIVLDYRWFTIPWGEHEVTFRTFISRDVFEREKTLIFDVMVPSDDDPPPRPTPGFDIISITVAMIVGFLLVAYRRKPRGS